MLMTLTVGAPLLLREQGFSKWTTVAAPHSSRVFPTVATGLLQVDQLGVPHKTQLKAAQVLTQHLGKVDSPETGAK